MRWIASLVFSLALAPQVFAEPAAAPDFTLKDLDGKTVKLSDFKGKTVVLEWFNPECPFVQASHTNGSLVDTAKKQMAHGVVGLAINSSAPGKQGYGVEKNREAQKRFGLTHPILLDETGTVGHAYGATNTPNMFVIDARGRMVYRGAIDNSPDAERGSPEGGMLVNYVEAALADIANGDPISVDYHRSTLINARSLFSWCVDEGWVQANPSQR